MEDDKGRILITGAYGFIGRYTAKYYHQMGYYVIGLGHGTWNNGEEKEWGIDEWHGCDIIMESLMRYGTDVDIIIHCAGSGSVGFSIEKPMYDFERTVWTTHFVLEYIRKYSPNTKLIYLSSAAVYGNKKEMPIIETSVLNPISPYGFHKKVAEELCKMYSEIYNVQVIVTRLFSVYGNELKKQLIWDACKKIADNNNNFWGTGMESRDFIHVKDVARALYILRDRVNKKYNVVNIGSGQAVLIKDIVEKIFKKYNTHLVPNFTGDINEGNPSAYLADVHKIREWGFYDEISLDEGITEYVHWFRKTKEN
ncbi:NAD-dependent epimerase/dehydratase family protein [Pectinatus frisingensis]|uniref:NAD-dependent epimerase/dehydratase family protein n=1 Tax=Pectinatus frisingensis TaxID=865 RepID=UPI003D809E12